MHKPRLPQPKRRSQGVEFGLYLDVEEVEEFAHPVTAAATELKNGMWFIHLSTNAASSVHTVHCGPTSLELSSSIVNSQVTLILSEMQGKRFFKLFAAQLLSDFDIHMAVIKHVINCFILPSLPVFIR